jgi:hypothetical protein
MSIFKKTTVLGLSTVLVFSMVAPVFANESTNHPTEEAATDTASGTNSEGVTESEIVEATVSKEEAIDLANEYVDIPDGYQQERINYNSRYYRTGHGVWEIHFEKTDKNRQYHAYIRVSIDAEYGKLIGFNKYDSAKENTYPPKVDLKEAKAIAEDFLENENKELLEQLKYNDNFEKNFKTPLQGDVRYRFQYDRLENGITFPMNHIIITVDGNGHVIEYNYYWDESIDFNSPENTINEAEAIKILSEVEFELVYKIPWREREKEQSPYLAYQMKQGFMGINANTGEFINHSGKGLKLEQDYSTLTNEPLKQLPLEDLELNQEEALKRIQEYFTLPAKAKLENARFEENNYHNRWHNRSTWNFNWRVEDGDGRYNQYIWASVDSQTGEIIQYNKDRERHYKEHDSHQSPEVSTRITPEEAIKAAVNKAKELVPYYTDQLYLVTPHFEQLSEEELKELRDYNFSFNRIINGVRTEMDNVHLSIDAQTGDVVRFSNNVTKINYPSETPDVIEIEKAKEIYFSQFELSLRYHLFNNHNYYGPKEEKENEEKIAELIYQLVPKYRDQPIFLDAQTGEWRNNENGEVTTLEKVEATDIEGHWAEKQLQLMIDYEAIDVINGKVMPSKKITRGELIKMLIVSMNGGHYRPHYGMERSASFADVNASSAYFSYVETAVDRGIIDKNNENFYPDQTITREDMADLIVRALGYSSLAEYDHIFSLSTKDAGDVSNKGSVAIVMGLEIMTENDNSFFPKREVTRAEAAMSFYRYLEKRAVLQENKHF